LLGRSLESSGLFGLDFVLEDGTGAAYLLEMNPRCTPLSHLQLGRGRDMINALWAQVSGNPLPVKPSVTEREMIAYFPNAWTSGVEYLKDSFHDIPHSSPELVQALLNPPSIRKSIFEFLRRKRGVANDARSID
jgi:predicted ATP-grasp superfamily ATP-dependent carboligase